MVPMHQGEAGKLTNSQITKWADDYKEVLSRMQFGIEEELQSPSSFVLELVFEPNLEGLDSLAEHSGEGISVREKSLWEGMNAWVSRNYKYLTFPGGSLMI